MALPTSAAACTAAACTAGAGIRTSAIASGIARASPHAGPSGGRDTAVLAFRHHALDALLRARQLASSISHPLTCSMATCQVRCTALCLFFDKVVL